MQRELDSLVFRRGGLVYEASNSAEGRVRREREAWQAAKNPVPQGWPTPEPSQAAAGAAGADVHAPKRSKAAAAAAARPKSAAWAAGYTSTVDVQSGALDRSTGLSSPNWFSQVGPHSDAYGPEYYASRHPKLGAPYQPSPAPSVADTTSARVPPPLTLAPPPPTPPAGPARPPPRTCNTPPSPGASQFPPPHRRARSAGDPGARAATGATFAQHEAATASASVAAAPSSAAAASADAKGPPHTPSVRVRAPATPPPPPSTMQPHGLLFKFLERSAGSPNPAHRRKQASPFYPPAWGEPGGSYESSYAANYTANYGETRRKQLPLQIKIADRFDRPSIHSRLEAGCLAPAVAVPNIDQRTSLKGHMVTYPWAPHE